MSRPHDRGGMAAGSIDTSEHDLAQWEKNTHALMGILSGDLKLIGGSRAAIESIPPDTADMRYLVVPQRPSGTENLTEEELADLVTRDSMIGVAKALSPGE